VKHAFFAKLARHFAKSKKPTASVKFIQEPVPASLITRHPLAKIILEFLLIQ
jgi:hypothetical protein